MHLRHPATPAAFLRAAPAPTVPGCSLSDSAGGGRQQHIRPDSTKCHCRASLSDVPESHTLSSRTSNNEVQTFFSSERVSSQSLTLSHFRMGEGRETPHTYVVFAHTAAIPMSLQFRLNRPSVAHLNPKLCIQNKDVRCHTWSLPSMNPSSQG